MNWADHMAGAVMKREKPMAVSTMRCVLCGIALGGDPDDDEGAGVCADCKDRPEAKRLGERRGVAGKGGQASARAFTDAERSLIRKVHGFMQPAQLLAILNERLACDLGPDAMPYTMEQLHEEIGLSAPAAGRGRPQDWASLRKLLAQARRNGVLDKIGEQVIHDFAVVFQLNAKQMMSLKDIVLRSGDEE